MSAAQQIVLIGLSGVGKSTVGRLLADRLSWTFIDTDEVIAENKGQTPAQLIVERGEDAFRQIEAAVVAESSKRAPAVIAIGGGAFMSDANRRALGERGLVCYLDATPPEISRRIRESVGSVERPLLGEDLEARLYELDRERRPFYNHADVWIPAQAPDVEGAAPGDGVATRVLRAWVADSAGQLQQERRLERLATDAPAMVPAAVVDTGNDRTPIWIGAGEIERLPERLEQLELRGKIFLISDSDVMEAHGQRVASVLDRGGLAGASYVVPTGEGSKSLRVAEELYRWLAEQRAERNDIIVALGGGVVGDLAGHVAATYLRGMPLVQLPTSVLAMNDAAVGGKVAVDLPAGKNLIGAFHQPKAVISDVETLGTLPRRALIEGFAEVIKHALILDPELLKLLQSSARTLTGNSADFDLLTEVTARSVSLKALIVSSDPEERGLRAILNYGHTIGHAIESVTGYSKYLHGEAVSIGMMGAARIAQRMGLISEEFVASQADVLHSYGLPLQAQGLASMAIRDATRMDKKVQGGRSRFVLLEAVGRAVVRDDVPEEMVEETIRSLVAS
ncbi:MAG TPA: 3-dehydroquinate synthase [Dehalococcoidia bacterium]|nr:3-dehydroquinate synthase [Dehalococcoidia bacterium]